MCCKYRLSKYALIFILIFIVAANPAAGDSSASKHFPLTVAVIDFIPRGIDFNSTVVFSDRLRASLSKYAEFKVLEPGKMDLILKDKKNQIAGVCDFDSCLIEIGRLLETQLIVAGTVGKIEQLYTFNLRMVEVETGKVLHSIIQEVDKLPSQVLTYSIPRFAEKFHDIAVHILLATLVITTNPEKAQFLLNDKEMGLTPMELHFIEGGTYALHLSKENYLDITDSLSLKNGVLTSQSYNLKCTDKYAAVLRAQRQKRTVRILQGIGMVGSITAIAAGGYYEKKLQRIVSDQKNIIGDYNNARDGADFSSYKNRYDQNSRLFDRYETYRNLGYIAGIMLVSGVTITFFF